MNPESKTELERLLMLLEKHLQQSGAPKTIVRRVHDVRLAANWTATK